MDKSIESQIIKIINKLSKKKVNINSKILDEGILDSLLTMKLIEKIEKQFSILIPPEEFSHHNFNTIPNITKLVEKLKK